MSESALLRAVRDEIRQHADFLNRQVQVELDEHAPPTTGDLYVMVIPAGVEPGPYHATNQGAIDKLYSVDVAIAMRAPKVPTDMQRDVFISLTDSLETYQRAIESKVDFQYPVLTAANALISTEESPLAECEGFREPLAFGGVGRIRRAPSELFAGHPGEPVAAIVRTIHFRGARYLRTRSA